MVLCKICKKNPVSKFLGVCADCIRNQVPDSFKLLENAYKTSREFVDLPLKVPKNPNGILCNLCVNECKIGIGEIGYCGLRKNKNGKMIGPTKTKAKLHAYFDRNPTNCCAAWFCPAATGCGYPKYTRYKNGEFNTYNYSVFFYGCSFNCLFCQNESHKTKLKEIVYIDIDTVVQDAMREDSTCLCFFGGSPEPHFPFALNLSRQLIKEKKGIYRICWEWNGTGNPELVRQAAELSLVTGGIIKFDLKTYDKNLGKALYGVDNKRTFENFKVVSKLINRRPNIPLLTATTLLVPYYVDEIEIEKISKFIAEIDENIPYSMLVFYPHFFLADLPITPNDQVKKCYKVAKHYLKRVNIGNFNLLGSIGNDFFF